MGNGTLLLGVALAVAELRALGLITARPRLIAVQAEAVSPLAAAFRAGADDLLPVGAGDLLGRRGRGGRPASGRRDRSGRGRRRRGRSGSGRGRGCR
ncbi:hypothetical protein SCALM49S_03337 [Streptomyces californicus]